MSDLVSFSSSTNIRAGAQINLGDLVLVSGADTLGYSAGTVDYACVKTGGATGGSSLSLSPSNALNRNPCVTVNGFVYSVGAAQNTMQGPLQVNKANPIINVGSVYPGSSVTLSTAVIQMNSPILLQLSNDTIACVWSEGSGSGDLYFAIVDVNLVIQVERTHIDTVASQQLAACSFFNPSLNQDLPGFCVAYQSGGSPQETKFASYNNAGAVATASTTVQTFGAVGSAIALDVHLLPSGNIAYAAVSGSSASGSEGVWVGVIEPSGTLLQAPQNAFATTDGPITARPFISVATGASAGTFAVSTGVTTWKIAVFNLSGVLQGSHTTGSNATTSSNLSRALVYQAGFYWLVWTPAAGSNIWMTQMELTGALQSELIVFAGTNSTIVMAAAAVDNLIVIALAASSTTVSYCVVQLMTSNGVLALAPIPTVQPTVFITTSSSGAASQFLSLVAAGDFTVLCVADFSTGASYTVAYLKVASHAVMGVAAAGGSAGELVSLNDTLNRSYAINPLVGSAVGAFNMTSATPPNVGGREGNLGNNYVSFSG